MKVVYGHINCLSTLLSDSRLTTAKQKREQTAKELYIDMLILTFVYCCLFFRPTHRGGMKEENDEKFANSAPRVSPPEFHSSTEWPFPRKREVCEYFENF